MRLFLVVFLGALFLFSCQTQRAVYNYLEDVRDTSFKKTVYIAESVIQKNDLLSIQIYSASLDPGVDALYNTTAGAGYLVDVKGNIEMPRLGTIRAEGLTKSELEEVIKARLKGQLNQPNVLVRFQNFRITVLGEVGAPGVLNVPTERLTILEAVGMSGGITQFGKIKEVKILRENNGVRQMGTLDLTSQKIFQ